jgi:hypothetical protein
MNPGQSVAVSLSFAFVSFLLLGVIPDILHRIGVSILNGFFFMYLLDIIYHLAGISKDLQEILEELRR